MRIIPVKPKTMDINAVNADQKMEERKSTV